MRRRLWRVAAAWWLLQLGACGDQPSAKSAHGIPAHAAPPGAHSDSAYRAGGDRDPLETPEISWENAPRATAAEARRDVGATTEQLAQRYGKTRAVGVLRGNGSYYADKLAGRATASGALYEPSGFTAAHRTLPFGTVLRVTRVEGGQIVYVRVTDRGPFGPRGRILDLSRAAAERLGMLRAGVTKLSVEIVELGPRTSRRRRHR